MCAFWKRALFPQAHRCAFCSRAFARRAGNTVTGVSLCAQCTAEIGWIAPPRCEQCGRQLPADTAIATDGIDPPDATGVVDAAAEVDAAHICGDCERFSGVPLVTNRAVVQYTPLARELVSVFKYRGRQSLAVPLGLLMAELVQREYRRQLPHVVTYVPLHARREAERGFNQAALLAAVIARQLRLPLHHLLARDIDTPKQSKRGRQQRLASLDRAFSVNVPVRRNFYRQVTLLIVDDIYTTGATLRACARELSQLGVPRLLAVTFAR
ncbi:ComF family protein [Numidum massiliense]|uniref:ComF family protein n=1 Tax=Numidum massiliense TaxID=1522315 RepID=UPI0006D59706|nr:double zinc ribbon domain-containing protein [Numidum massiliense]